MPRKRLKRLGWLVLTMPLLAVLSFMLWALWIPEPMPEALAASQSNQHVAVTDGKWLVFQPTERVATTGLIVYPGARVDARAYAPTAQAIAAQGYLVVVVPMPLNFAVFAPSSANAVIETFPEIKHWTVGGHSLGGAMAAQFAAQNPRVVDGLVLWASYPPSSSPLTTHALLVVSIYGTRDGLATPDDMTASRSLLPATTVFVPVQGGNHAQFGWYGAQSGDNNAAISREQQQQQIVEATLSLLREVTVKADISSVWPGITQARKGTNTWH